MSTTLCVATLTVPALVANDEIAFHCSDAPITVLDGTEQDAESVCRAGQRAIKFLSAHGLSVDGPLRVRVVRSVGDGLVGKFDGSSRDIIVQSFADCAEAVAGAPPFGIPMGRELHASFIVHEIVHAVAGQHFVGARPPRAAHEYIAYTAQLATMDVELREKILARYGVPAYQSETEISSIYLALDPAAFAVKSYRHFVKLSDRTRFYRRLLNGEVDFSAPEWR